MRRTEAGAETQVHEPPSATTAPTRQRSQQVEEVGVQYFFLLAHQPAKCENMLGEGAIPRALGTLNVLRSIT